MKAIRNLLPINYAFIPPAGVASVAVPTRAKPVPGSLATISRFLKNVALFIAAPFVGLAYVVIGPFVGLGILAVLGCKALVARGPKP